MFLRKKLSKLILLGSLFLGSCVSYDPIKINGLLSYDSPDPKNLEQRISRETTIPNNKQDKYAVLLGGNTQAASKVSLFLVYKALLNKGFLKENIYVLDSPHEWEISFYTEKPNVILYQIFDDTKEKTAFYPIDSIASKETIKKVFDHLAKKTDVNDYLFIYTTGHGGRKDFWTKLENGEWKLDLNIPTLLLPGKDLKVADLEQYISNLKVKKGVVVCDQCYSGGFAERIGKGNFVAISSSERGRVSFGNTFTKAFFAAWKDKSADKNNDKRISIKEAFDYAVKNDDYTKEGLQKPQMISDLNPEDIFLYP